MSQRCAIRRPIRRGSRKATTSGWWCTAIARTSAACRSAIKGLTTAGSALVTAPSSTPLDASAAARRRSTCRSRLIPSRPTPKSLSAPVPRRAADRNTPLERLTSKFHRLATPMSDHGIHVQYVPKSALAKWFESRLPLIGLIHSSFVAFPVPRNLNYFWTFGGVLAFMLTAQIVTGVVLAMHYDPNAKTAFDSVEHIMRDVNYGWMLRYLHANGASMFFAAVYIHIFRNLYYGSYKAPREILYIIGVLIFLLMMATAFLGYTLPWGQMSFWGATVITNILAAIPVVGDTIQSLLWGGYSVGNPTLNRFFSLHYLMPFMIFGLVILHIWALHVPGNNNPTGIPIKSGKEAVPFHPYMTVKDGFSLVLFLFAYAWFTFYTPNYLGHADNYVPANPAVTPAHIVPEWYFLPFYAILRAIPDKLGGVIAMFGAVVVLALVPWLDTSRVRSANYRPIYRQFFWVFMIVCLLLGWLGAKPPEGGYVLEARICTAYYFAHFLIVMPLLGLFETPTPMPNSILESVTGPGKQVSAGAGAGVPVGAAAEPSIKG